MAVLPLRNFPFDERAIGVPIIPVLDLAQGDRVLAAELGSAFRDIGFVSVVNHGVPAPTIRSLYEAANVFFDLPAEPSGSCSAAARPESRLYRLWRGDAGATWAAGRLRPIYKDIFSIGPFDLPDDTYTRGPAAYPSFAPNLWPSNPPELQPAMRAYWQAITPLAQRMLGISAARSACRRTTSRR